MKHLALVVQSANTGFWFTRSWKQSGKWMWCEELFLCISAKYVMQDLHLCDAVSKWLQNRKAASSGHKKGKGNTLAWTKMLQDPVAAVTGCRTIISPAVGRWIVELGRPFGFHMTWMNCKRHSLHLALDIISREQSYFWSAQIIIYLWLAKMCDDGKMPSTSFWSPKALAPLSVRGVTFMDDVDNTQIRQSPIWADAATHQGRTQANQHWWQVT